MSVNSRNDTGQIKMYCKTTESLMLNLAIRAITTWLEMVKVFSQYLPWYSANSGPRQLCRYSDSLGAGRYGDRILVWARYIVPVQAGPGTDRVSFLRGKRPERDLNNPTHLAPRLKK